MTDCIIGVDATTGYMWSTTRLDQNWQRSTGNEALLAAAGCNEENEVVGVKTDNAEVTSADLGSSWSAGSVNQTGSMLGVRTVPTTNPALPGAEPGSLLAVGTDHQIYAAPNLQSGWTLHSAPGAVIDAFVMGDGTIVGVGTDNQLYTRASLAAGWSGPVANSGLVKSACPAGGVLTPTSNLLGVGMDDKIWTRSSLNSTWQPTTWPSTAPTGGVIYIAVGSSGSGPLPL